MEETNLFKEHNNDSIIVYKSFYKDFFATIIKKVSFILPCIILLSIFIVGLLFCHFIDIDNHMAINLKNSFISPSFEYPFGTNQFGQNQLYSIFIGAYKTLALAFCATAINTILGIIFGIMWGTNKLFDKVMFVIKNIVDNVPLIFFYVLIIMFLGDGFIPLLIVVVIFGWVDFAYLVRNNLMIIKSKDYNKVSQLFKVPMRTRAFNNYLPSILPILFNNIALCIPKIVALEILISYFGFSFGGSYPSLGMLFYSSIYSNNYFIEPHVFFIPFAFLLTINLCTYFISKTISNNFIKERI